MLKLVNIVKDYPMKDQEPVHALKGLSISFRKNEFVSILGPSGCGKTTLLNIIGGLDRYTSGDLLIQDVSTKDYKDGDWDTYRNHSIGFVFQSYNLIMHQSVIKNVELALTIGGVSKEERRARALKALEKVGLGGLDKKKPNQLSGGQMQRVAIARALINEPEILLADEPTGALDSETSIQVMDLLKEVAKDCLVIMVTHNPDLANAYANRIIMMKDGLLLSDSHPYDDEDIDQREIEEINNTKVSEFELEELKAKIRDLINKELTKKPYEVNGPITIQHIDKGVIHTDYSSDDNKEVEEVVEEVVAPVITNNKEPKKIKKPKEEKKVEKKNKGNKKNSSMSFFTAMGLSLSNLLSKLKRTILVAIAGSIGIIGVSAVLAVSTGVHNYIDEMQNDMISQYPLSIAETSIDYMTLLTGLSNDDGRKIVEFAKEREVGLDSLINYLMDKYKDFTSVKTNDINNDLLEYIDGLPTDAVSSIHRQYGIDMTNNIFTKWKRNEGIDETFVSLNGLTQTYIAELKTVPGFSEYAVFVDLFTDFMKEIPAKEDYILEQYDIIAGSYPKSADEIVLVVDENQTLTDLIYAQMGFFTEKEFINIARKAIAEHEDNPDQSKIDSYSYPTSYTFEEILNKKLYYYPHDSIWNYNTLSFDVASFEATLPVAGRNLNMLFTFQYDEVMDCLTGSIEVEGYNLNANFYRQEGSVKDDSNPFVGEWEGTVLGTTFKFSVTDTKVILHLASNMEYTLNGNEVQFNLGDETNPSMVNIVYKDASDSFSGTYTYMGYPLPITVTRSGGTKGDNPILGNWMGEIIVMGNPYQMNFSLKENGILTFYNDSTYDYTKTVNNIEGYMYSAEAQNSWTNGTEMKISAILKKKAGVNFGCLSRGVYYTTDLTKKMMADAKDSQIINDTDHGIKRFIGSAYENDKSYKAYVTFKYTSYAKGDGPLSVNNVKGYAMALNTDLSSSLSSLISIRGSSNLSLDKAYLRSLSGLAAKLDSETNLYNFEPLPENVDIYPKDFTKKDIITDYLKKWNSDEDIKLSSGKVLKSEDRQELTYSDTVELIINVINTMINVITIALVSFTSLALVVSCFMIAVITYISTMERVKEIGVIRSLGGRKKDVSRLFVAECLIIGLSSGLIGVGVTYLLSLILNIVITSLNVGVTVIAVLPLLTALIMIGISVLLNVLSGLIPAMKASNQDPVAALRSE